MKPALALTFGISTHKNIGAWYTGSASQSAVTVVTGSGSAGVAAEVVTEIVCDGAAVVAAAVVGAIVVVALTVVAPLDPGITPQVAQYWN